MNPLLQPPRERITSTVRRRFGAIASSFLLLGAVSCNKQTPTNNANQPALPSKAPENKAPTKPPFSRKPKLEKIDGAPIFFRSPPVQQPVDLPKDAEVGEFYGRLVGELKLVNGCLQADGATILWERKEQATLKTLIQKLRAKQRILVDLGGGSLNAMMNDQTLRETFPAIYYGCPKTKRIWVSHGLEWKILAPGAPSP